jgi:hypothetical protein
LPSTYSERYSLARYRIRIQRTGAFSGEGDIVERIIDVSQLLDPARLPGYSAARGIVRKLREAGHAAYIVGGGVRDLLLGLQPKDYDVVTSARPEQVESVFPKTIPVGRAFGVITVIWCGEAHEVATFRAEGDYVDGRRPGWVKFTDLEADLQRRDFTINGLVLDPESGEVHDLVGGLDDLSEGIVRTIGAPEERFSEDALRMLRAIRFSSRFRFRLERSTLDALCSHAHDIRRVAGERVWAELQAMMSGTGRTDALTLLRDTGLMAAVLPESAGLTSDGPASLWPRTVRRVQNLHDSASAAAAWACIVADIAGPDEPSRDLWDDDGPLDEVAGQRVERLLFRLRAPGAIARSAGRIIRRRWFWRHASRARLGGLCRVLRHEAQDELITFWRADSSAFGRSAAMAPVDQAVLRMQLFGLDASAGTPAPLNGQMLLELGMDRGPDVGRILAEAERLWLEGVLPTPVSVNRWAQKAVKRQ